MTLDQSCREHDASLYARFPVGLMRGAVLAMICFGVIAPAHASEKSPKQTTAAVAPGSEAKLPNDDLAAAMTARGKGSDKDNAVLMPLAGVWDYTESFWPNPKAEPEHAMGSVTNDLVLGRRFLSSKATGSLNIGRESIPFESQELMGFDTGRKTYESTLADTMTTGMMIGGGTYDEKKHTITTTGHFTNPLTGVDERFRSEIALVDTDHYKRTIFAADKSGKETKLAEIDYTRRK